MQNFDLPKITGWATFQNINYLCTINMLSRMSVIFIACLLYQLLCVFLDTKSFCPCLRSVFVDGKAFTFSVKLKTQLKEVVFPTKKEFVAP